MNSKRAPERTLCIGVDVGGTKVAAMVADRDDHALARAQVPTDISSPERTLDCIARAVERALALVPASLGEVAAIGLGVPGRVRPECGLVESAVNLRWRHIKAGPMLEERFGVPCRLENDARAAALGAYASGEDRRYQDWAYISVGTGIAAGLILNGRLYRGPNGMAGEIGHMIVADNGPVCACGLRGCLETVAAGPAIVRAVREQLAASSEAQTGGPLVTAEPLTAARVYAAAREGDALALAVTRQAGFYLAHAVHALVMTCDVERVVFGGGVARAGALFLEPIGEELARLRQVSPLAGEVLRPDLLGLLPDGYEAALWGALALARQLVTERSD